jgi:hypothetical protein
MENEGEEAMELAGRGETTGIASLLFVWIV